ncbi:MAG: HTH domain-containing protein [Actinobacteria bacterium]|nr:HTH domain-containing protein [Actinomycetota bacterium]
MQKLTSAKPTPTAVLHRLSLYHCLLTDWLLASKKGAITSKELASTLGLNEVTVRNDLSFLGETPGKRGVGYSIDGLRQMLGEFLGLPPFAPVAFVGSAKVVSSLFSFFLVEKFGFISAAFFSEDPNDRTAVINGREVQSIEAISPELASMGVNIAVVITHPTWVQHSINLLAQAGVKGILVLTPSVVIEAPEGVHVTQIRIPCDLKALFHRVSLLDQQA